MSDSESPSTNFTKLLIPEIFSEILRYVSKKDRKNIRLCCHATEVAVARSDFHSSHSGIINGEPFRSDFGSVHLKLGYRFKMEKGISWEDVLTVRKRLFARAHMPKTYIRAVDFHETSVACVDQLLEGCVFPELIVVLKREEFVPEIVDFLQKHKAKLTLIACNLDLDVLLSFQHMNRMEIRMSDQTLPEETFLVFVNKRHSFLKFPTPITSGQMMFDAIESIYSNDERSTEILFSVSSEALKRFNQLAADSSKKLKYQEIKEANKQPVSTTWYREKVRISITKLRPKDEHHTVTVVNSV